MLEVTNFGPYIYMTTQQVKRHQSEFVLAQASSLKLLMMPIGQATVHDLVGQRLWPMLIQIVQTLLNLFLAPNVV